MIRVIPSEVAPDGTTYLASDALIVGCRPLTDQEDWQREARWIVQNGLRDVLEWLGEKPIPRHPLPGRKLLDNLINTIRLQGGPADGATHHKPDRGFSPLNVAISRRVSLFEMLATSTGPDFEPLYDVATYEQVWQRRWGVVMPIVTPASEFLYRYTGGS